MQSGKLNIPIHEYLHTSFSNPDSEFQDGEVVERSMPDYLHGKTQALLCGFFLSLRKSHSLHPCAETRMQLSHKRVLIPDVTVFHSSEPQGLPDSPPLVAIEILSPDDRLKEVREKLDEYRVWGVPHVWLLDPDSRRIYTCEERLREVESLEIREMGIALSSTDVFD